MKEIFDKVSAECSRNLTRTYSTSFSLGINFLDKKIRGPIYAIYGFVRLADEIVDSFHGYDKASLLSKFKRDCLEAIVDSISLNPVLNSFQEVVKRYSIELELIHLFLNSMEMDLQSEVYSPEKYERYILGSAQVVGLMCLHVFTEGDSASYERLKGSAMKLGSAFQKVNFLRDVNADFHLLGRTYFPGVDLSYFSDEKKRAIEEDIAAEFDAALEGIRELPRSSRNGVYLAYIYYRKLFDKIRKKTANQVMAERIRISNAHKFTLMFSSLLRQQTGRI
ncbi:phytoene/squalene synthase family protein [Pedobacter psychrodurus]|uniref:Phytoene/squalene synthase family protein n=1 Tax=Pedobacter psychrodurus TaxID=2530456 RepID=A0A4R0Q1K6_9SPHI|nr:phytoene/squalene synthase family protein [Pedobacter psychrodurus]TCD26527.1 phytoene/squalene synthase family protein [Pedobacter psychrodurus]